MEGKYHFETERQMSVAEAAETLLRIARSRPAVRINLGDYKGLSIAAAKAKAEWNAMTPDEQEHARNSCGYNPENEWGGK